MKIIDQLTMLIVSIVMIGLGWPGVRSELLNVALNKPASQIDSYKVTSGAEMANDGNSNQNFNGGSCTATASTTKTWWMVDLLQNYNILAVRIHNRSDKYTWRLQDFYVYTSTTNPLPMPTALGDPFKGELCFYHADIMPQTDPQPVYCDTHPVKARYVYLWKEAQEKLTICEFEVLAEEYDMRQAATTLTYRGQKSNLAPLHSKGQINVSSSFCLAICLSKTGEAFTHFQVNKMSGVCDCMKSDENTHSALILTSNENVDVYLVVRGPERLR